jgi:uncharacterized membrane protein
MGLSVWTTVRLGGFTLLFMRWENTVLIEAPTQVVWRLTVDVANWPSFTPTMQRVERLDDGPVHVGSTVRVKQPGQTPAVWTVTRVDPGQQFTWQTSRMGVTMTASHILEPFEDKCRNTVALDLTGPMSRPFAMIFGGMMRTALDTENAGFKATAESTPPTPDAF